MDFLKAHGRQSFGPEQLLGHSDKRKHWATLLRGSMQTGRFGTEGKQDAAAFVATQADLSDECVVTRCMGSNKRAIKMTSLGTILMAILGVAWWIVIIHIIMGWLINFQVLNLRQPVVAQIYFGLNNMLEPIYRPIRRFLPPTGGLDFSPIIVFLGIYALQVIVRNNLIYG